MRCLEKSNSVHNNLGTPYAPNCARASLITQDMGWVPRSGSVQREQEGIEGQGQITWEGNSEADGVQIEQQDPCDTLWKLHIKHICHIYLCHTYVGPLFLVMWL